MKYQTLILGAGVAVAAAGAGYLMQSGAQPVLQSPLPDAAHVSAQLTLPDETGELRRILVVATDVTDLERAREALAASERKFRGIENVRRARTQYQWHQ